MAHPDALRLARQQRTQSSDLLRQQRIARTLRRMGRSPFSEEDTEDNLTRVQTPQFSFTEMDADVLHDALEAVQEKFGGHAMRQHIEKIAHTMLSNLHGQAGHKGAQGEIATRLLTNLAYYSRLPRAEQMRLPHLLDDLFPSSLGLMLVSYLSSLAAKYLPKTPSTFPPPARR